MPLKFIPTNVKYNDSGEFKNISIPADRAYMGEVITVSSTQPTNSDNKLWINTNEQTKQTYQIPTMTEMEAADNTILGNLATIESSQATAAHAVGEYIVYNGQLYKVTAAIASGQTLTVGTNISAVSGGGLNDLQSQFTPYNAGYSDFNSSSFQFESWGRIYVYVSGHVCVIGISGLKPTTNLTANTAICKIPFVAKSAVMGVLTNGGKAFIQLNNNTVYATSGISAGTELNGQLCIMV